MLPQRARATAREEGESVRTRLAVAVSLALLLQLAQAPPTAATHFVGLSFPFCGGSVTTDCVSAFTVNGAAPAANLTVDAFITSGALQVQVHNTANANTNELAPTLSATSVVTVSVRLNTFQPVVAIGTGLITSWSWNATTREFTITATPRSSSWATPTCIPGSCPTNASIDHNAMLLFAAQDLTIEGLTPEQQAQAAAFLAKFNGGYVATNAQYFVPPLLNPLTGAIEFELGAPHCAASSPSGGCTVNTGFFRVLIPDAVITDLWGRDPNALTGASLSANVAGQGAVSITLSRVAATATSPAGLILENAATFSYSTTTVSIAPASPSFRAGPGYPGFGITDLALFNAARRELGLPPLTEAEAAPYLVRFFELSGRRYATRPGESIEEARVRVIAGQQ